VFGHRAVTGALALDAAFVLAGAIPGFLVEQAGGASPAIRDVGHGFRTFIIKPACLEAGEEFIGNDHVIFLDCGGSGTEVARLEGFTCGVSDEVVGTLAEQNASPSHTAATATASSSAAGRHRSAEAFGTGAHASVV